MASPHRSTREGKIRGGRLPATSRGIRRRLSNSRESSPARLGHQREDVQVSDRRHIPCRLGAWVRESAWVASKQMSFRRLSYPNSSPCRSRSRSSLPRRRLTPQRCRELSQRFSTKVKVQSRGARSHSKAAPLDAGHRRRVDQSSSASDEPDHLLPPHSRGRVRTRRRLSDSIAVLSERRSRSPSRSPKRGQCSISHAKSGQRLTDSQVQSGALCLSNKAGEAAPQSALACLHSLSQEDRSFKDTNTRHTMPGLSSLPYISSDFSGQRSSLGSSSADARPDTGNPGAFDSVGLVRELRCLVSMLIPRSHTQASFITPPVS